MEQVHIAHRVNVNVLAERDWVRGQAGAARRRAESIHERPRAGRFPPLSNSLPHEEVVQFMGCCFILPLGESDAVAAGEGFWCWSVRLSLANRIDPLLA